MIFISYTHKDNQAFSDNWISEFHRLLEARLLQLFGEDRLSVFRDTSGLKQAESTLSEEIIKNIKESRYLMPILSPGYLRSDWCELERNTFIESNGLQDALRRLFPIEKLPVMKEKGFPEIFSERYIYKFYTYNEETRNPMELEPEDKQFAVLINDLAYSIKKQLAAKEAGPSKGKIYLADPSYDMMEKRDALKRELEMRGYEVLPAGNLPYVKDQAEEKIREWMSECLLTIHPVGKMYGMIPDGSDHSLPEMQFRISEEFLSKDKFQRLVWNPFGKKFDPQAEQQGVFLEYLSTDPAAQKKMDRIEAPLEVFKTVLGDALEPARRKPLQANKSLEQICILHPKGLKKEIGPIHEILHAAGFKVRPAEFSLEGGEVVISRPKRLKEAEACLIFHQGDEDDLFDLLDGIDEEELDHKAVFIPVGTEAPLVDAGISVLDQTDGQDVAETLKPWIEALKGGEAGE